MKDLSFTRNPDGGVTIIINAESAVVDAETWAKHVARVAAQAVKDRVEYILQALHNGEVTFSQQLHMLADRFISAGHEVSTATTQAVTAVSTGAAAAVAKVETAAVTVATDATKDVQTAEADAGALASTAENTVKTDTAAVEGAVDGAVAEAKTDVVGALDGAAAVVAKA